MIKRRALFSLAAITILHVFLFLDISQAESQLKEEKPTLLFVKGQLASEKHGDSEWLILHAKNGETFLLEGELLDKLKGLLSELGEDNLVFIVGMQDGRYNISCKTSYKYENEKNEGKETKKEAVCIRYYNLAVGKIMEANKSSEKMPPPKRSSEDEVEARQASLQSWRIDASQTITREATIVSLNLKPALKTIKISYKDKDNQPREETLVVTDDTVVAKQNTIDDKNEPLYLKISALNPGQEIIIIYSRNSAVDFNNALYITIVKE